MLQPPAARKLLVWANWLNAGNNGWRRHDWIRALRNIKLLELFRKLWNADISLQESFRKLKSKILNPNKKCPERKPLPVLNNLLVFTDVFKCFSAACKAYIFFKRNETHENIHAVEMCEESWLAFFWSVFFRYISWHFIAQTWNNDFF